MTNDMAKDLKRSGELAPWVRCYKMQGSGNDFVLVDNRIQHIQIADMPAWARAVCRRAFGVGADGMIFLDNADPSAGHHPDADYIWHFYNADGSRAEMCGNGSRCAARLAWELGLAGPRHVLGTDAGPIKAEVFPETNTAKVELTPFHDLRLDFELELDGKTWPVHFVNTGVPHLVIFVQDLDAVHVQELGRRFRFHAHFAPAGCNVNFVRIVDPEHLLLRTYERGVEGETLACGTGAAASALVAHRLGHAAATTEIRTSGQERLGISIEQDVLFLTGPAVLVFAAEASLASLGLS